MSKLAPSWHPLNCIDEYLQARGWTCDDIGWTPPEALRAMVETHCGRGQFRRGLAVRIQADIDEWKMDHSPSAKNTRSEETMMPDVAQLAAEYQAGATLRELGERYAYSHTQIATFLVVAGVPRRHIWGRMKTCPACRRSFRARRGQIHCSNSCRRGGSRK